MKQLFTNKTTDGDSETFTIADVNPNQKQDPFIGITGTFDGATVTLYWKDPNDDWYATDSANDAWTSPVQFPVFMNSYSDYKLVISGAGGSTSINAWVFGGK